MTAKERAAKFLEVPIEKIDKVLSLQTPEMRSILLQSSEERAAHHDKDIPSNYLAVPDATTLAELVATRPITYEETKTYKRMRYEAGERLTEMRQDKIERLPDEVSKLEVRKKNAINAFMDKFTPHAIKDRFKKMMGGLFKPSHAEMVAAEMEDRNKK